MANYQFGHRVEGLVLIGRFWHFATKRSTRMPGGGVGICKGCPFNFSGPRSG